MKDPTDPPRWARRLLRRSVPERDRATLPDELEDLYHARRRRDGDRSARWWYARIAVGFAVRMALGGGRRLAGHTTDEGVGMGQFGRDLIDAGRRLVRAPVFSLVAVITVGTGIGAFASMFSVVDAVLLEEPAYETPDELRFVWRRYWFGLERGWLGGPDIAWLGESEAFDGVAGMQAAGMNLTAADGAGPENLPVTLASASFFDVLGVTPALGRGFRPGEDGADAAPVAVLSHALWTTRFGADPGVVGGDIHLDGERVTVIGVAPEDFRFVMPTSLGEPAPAELWMPLPYDLADLNPGSGMFAGVVRVADGVTPTAVDAAVDGVARRLDEIFGNRGLEMWSVGLLEDLTNPVRPALTALLGSAAFLLLILAANLATLLLGRAALRDRELAVRAALGAGRGRLVRTVLAESLLLGVAGAVLGVVAATFGVDLIRTLAPPDLPRLWAVEVDATVVLVAGMAALTMTLVAGLVPALRAARAGVAGRLRVGGRSGNEATGRVRGALVVTQIGLSLVLLVGAGLLARAFVELTRADPGFDPGAALAFELPLDPTAYPDDPAVMVFEGRLRPALAALPGVQHVGVADVLPLSASASQGPATFPGAPGNTGDRDGDAPVVDRIRIGTGFVEAAGLRLSAGRSFRDGDGATEKVAIIDDVLAQRFFRDTDPVGASLVTFGDTMRIVGVVDQARQYQVHSDDRPQVYVPFAWNAASTMAVVVRGASAAPSAREVRSALAALDPGIPMTDVATLADRVSASLGRERLSLTLLLTFAGSALLLSMLGVYGVVANTVTNRTHEMGVRMALGAERGRVLGMVIRQGVRLGVIGLAVGVAVAVAAAPLLERVIFGVEAFDVAVYGLVATGLLGVTVLACLIPARRATRIDPVRALRGE